MKKHKTHAFERGQLQKERDLLIKQNHELQQQLPDELPKALLDMLNTYTQRISALEESAKRPLLNTVFGKEPRALLTAEIQALVLTLEKNQLIQVYFLEKELIALNKTFLSYFNEIQNFDTLPEMIKKDLIRIQSARLVTMQQLRLSKTLNDLIPQRSALLLFRNMIKQGIEYIKSALILEKSKSEKKINPPSSKKPFSLRAFLWEKIAYAMAYALFLIQYLWAYSTSKTIVTAPTQMPPTPLDVSLKSRYASCPSPHRSPQPPNSPYAL